MSPRPSTHCKNGHFKTAETTRQRKGHGGKLYTGCRICELEANKRGKERTKARAKLGIRPVPGRKRGDAERATVDAMWQRLLASADRPYKQQMLEAKAEFDEWDARRTEKGRAKLKTHCRRDEVAA